MIKRFRAWLRDRRIKRFKRQFAEAYPDGAKFFDHLAWLDGTNEFLINGTINVPEVLIWTPPAHETIDTDF